MPNSSTSAKHCQSVVHSCQSHRTLAPQHPAPRARTRHKSTTRSTKSREKVADNSIESCESCEAFDFAEQEQSEPEAGTTSSPSSSRTTS
eukprot:1819375-Rhodomonas_salina.1